MANPKWRTNGQRKILKLQKLSYQGKNLYKGVFGVADYDLRSKIKNNFESLRWQIQNG